MCAGPSLPAPASDARLGLLSPTGHHPSSRCGRRGPPPGSPGRRALTAAGDMRYRVPRITTPEPHDERSASASRGPQNGPEQAPRTSLRTAGAGVMRQIECEGDVHDLIPVSGSDKDGNTAADLGPPRAPRRDGQTEPPRPCRTSGVAKSSPSPANFAPLDAPIRVPGPVWIRAFANVDPDLPRPGTKRLYICPD